MPAKRAAGNRTAKPDIRISSRIVRTGALFCIVKHLLQIAADPLRADRHAVSGQMIVSSEEIAARIERILYGGDHFGVQRFPELGVELSKRSRVTLLGESGFVAGSIGKEHTDPVRGEIVVNRIEGIDIEGL